MYPSIIGLVGHIRSGKSSIAQYLCDKYSYSLASNSELLCKIARNLGMNEDRENLKRLGDSIFSVLGNDTLAKFRLSQSESFPIIIDGIRYKEEIELYRQFPSFKLIGIESSEYLRFDRLNSLANQGKDSFMTKSEFHKLQYARSEAQVDELLKLAHTIIYNNKTKSELYLQVDELMKIWGEQKI